MQSSNHKHISSRAGRSKRVMLHCHDSYGIGHLRRTLTLAGALRKANPEVQILITSGSPCATHFDLPSGADIIKLPSVTKNELGEYVPRGLGSLGEVVRLRRSLLLETFRSFAPQLLIVDHQPLGLCGELTDVLEEAKRMSVPTLLGLRDILDEPAVVKREWSRPDIHRAMGDLYTKIVVYGEAKVFDIRVEYDLPADWRQKIEFTGYVVRDAPEARSSVIPSIRPLVLVTVGGGEDGVERIQTYMEMLEQAPTLWNSCLVLGPLFPQRAARSIKRRARLLNGIEVHSFHKDLPWLLAQADAVVSMAGYNSVTEIIQSGKPAVFWPRTFPRREQILRAEQLERLGIGACVPDPCPQRMRREIELALERGPSRSHGDLLKGAGRMCEIVQEMLDPDRERASQKVI